MLIELSAQIRPSRREFQMLVAWGDPAAAAKDTAGTAPKASIVGKVQPVAVDKNAPEAWKTSQSSLLDEPWV
jgi:hypothetical protein